MRILIVSSTYQEIEKTLIRFPKRQIIVPNRMERIQHQKAEIDILITGVGMLFTAYHLGKTLATYQYDFSINAGLSGAFDRQLALGEVVHVTKDFLPELGAENLDNFIPLSDLNLLSEFDHPYTKNGIENISLLNLKSILALKKVNGITVNTVHGNEKTIQKQMDLYFDLFKKRVQTETMEGAAFLHACIQSRLSCMQLRAVSNYVEPRNRDSWKIELAIENLNKKLFEIINEITHDGL